MVFDLAVYGKPDEVTVIGLMRRMIPRMFHRYPQAMSWIQSDAASESYAGLKHIDWVQNTVHGSHKSTKMDGRSSQGFPREETTTQQRVDQGIPRWSGKKPMHMRAML